MLKQTLWRRFDFDPLDVTKTWPEQLFPMQPVGRMVLNRNVDNFFNDNEQVAFCPAIIVPGGCTCVSCVWVRGSYEAERKRAGGLLPGHHRAVLVRGTRGQKRCLVIVK